MPCLDMDPDVSNHSTPEPNTKPTLHMTGDDTPVYRWTISQRSWGLSWPPKFIKGALHACSAFLSFVFPGIAWSWVQRFAPAYGSYGRLSFGFWVRFTVDDVVEEVSCQWSFSKCFLHFGRYADTFSLFSKPSEGSPAPQATARPGVSRLTVTSRCHLTDPFGLHGYYQGGHISL